MTIERLITPKFEIFWPMKALLSAHQCLDRIADLLGRIEKVLVIEMGIAGGRLMVCMPEQGVVKATGQSRIRTHLLRRFSSNYCKNRLFPGIDPDRAHLNNRHRS